MFHQILQSIPLLSVKQHGKAHCPNQVSNDSDKRLYFCDLLNTESMCQKGLQLPLRDDVRRQDKISLVIVNMKNIF